ncbi:uncharacterized protein LOC129316760 [Prosopis cineraria]|uniref:uncharacterized protein LOC129316760 n=1 Tax=Prosopis cineraria TaxID=364024 RepID=UPI00240E9E7B|nr:uncharacterized protein LOC129316760 [Prosopis cineraria]
MDVDGSVDSQRHAACGGVIRDRERNWVPGFKRSLGFLPSILAEIQAICFSLEVCQQFNLSQVTICSDAAEAISLLRINVDDDHPMCAEINSARDFLFSNSNIKLAFVRHETNRVMYCLAKNAHMESDNLTVLANVPAECSDLVLTDKLRFA